MAKNYDFRLVTTRPAGTGWTAASINAAQAAKAANTDSSVGPVNAMAQAPITADALRTTPSTLSDATLGSRRFLNPNTGSREVVASGSVYQQANVPAYLSQAVAGLNAEQALRRSLQAEWNNRLIRNAESSEDPYLWLEAIRAASVNPGSSVAFGQAIQNPNAARAQLISAQSEAGLNAMRSRILSHASNNLYDYNKNTMLANSSPAGSPWAMDAERRASNNLISMRMSEPLAVAAAAPNRGSVVSGWASRPASVNWI